MKLTLNVNEFLNHYKQHADDPKTKREKERAAKREARRLMREAIAKQEWDKVHGPVEIITGLTKDEWTPQIFNPEIHKWPEPKYIPIPEKPAQLNQADKRLKKKQTKALIREAREEAKTLERANRPTPEQRKAAEYEAFKQRFKKPKQPAPREVCIPMDQNNDSTQNIDSFAPREVCIPNANDIPRDPSNLHTDSGSHDSDESEL